MLKSHFYSLFLTQGIIQKILDIHKVRWTSCFGLRLSSSQSRDQVHWLHPDMGVSHIREKYEQARPNEEWRSDNNEGQDLIFKL